MMAGALRGTWWSLALRGVVALVFGLLFLVWPLAATEFAVKILFAVFCLLDGALHIISIFTKRQTDRGWWLVILEGLCLILLGLVTFMWPGFTFFLLVYFVAIRALLMGLFHAYMGISLMNVGASGWVPLLTGILAIAFGVFIFFNPESIVTLLGVLVLFIGVVFLVMAAQARSWTNGAEALQV